MNTHVYVKLIRPEGYEDVHPDLVIEDAGIKHVFEPEDATGEVGALRQRIALMNECESLRQRINELEAVIKSHGIPVKTMKRLNNA